MTTVFYQAIAAPVLVPSQETAPLESQWHQPWSDPVRFLVAPAVAIVLAATPGFFFDPLPIPNQTASADEYGFRFEDPVRQKPGLAAGLHQAVALTEAAPFAEAVTEDRWHQPWSEPSVKAKQGVAPASQPFLALTEAAPFAEAVTEDRWHQPWSEPSVKAKQGVAPASQLFLAFTEAAPFAEAVIYSKFGFAWSEPVRALPGLRAALQSFISWVYFESTNQNTDKWVYPWSEPVRIKPGLLTAAQISYFPQTEKPPFTLYSNWSYAWSEPVRARPGLIAPLQMAYPAFAEFRFPETVTESRWHFAWSEPVRVKPGPPSPEQAFLALDETSPIVSPSGWLYGYSEPVRVRPGIAAFQQEWQVAIVIVPLFASARMTLKNSIYRARTIGYLKPTIS